MWGGYPPNPPLFFFFFGFGSIRRYRGTFCLLWFSLDYCGFLAGSNLGVSLGGGKVVGGSKNFLFPIGRKIGGEVGEYANS